MWEEYFAGKFKGYWFFQTMCGTTALIWNTLLRLFVSWQSMEESVALQFSFIHVSYLSVMGLFKDINQVIYWCDMPKKKHTHSQKKPTEMVKQVFFIQYFIILTMQFNLSKLVCL